MGRGKPRRPRMKNRDFGWEPIMPGEFSKILIAVDFSEGHSEVIAEAAKFGRLGGELWLLHVAPPNPDFVGYEAGPQSVRDQVATDLREHHQWLQGEAERLGAEGIQAIPLLVQGSTVETILHEARRREVQMIILGSHGHGAVYHLLVGSTCEGVLHKAKCPVMVVPTHRRQE